MRKTNKAIVLDLGLTGYGIVKCLSEKDIPIIGLHNAEWKPIANHARFVEKSVVLSDNNEEIGRTVSNEETLNSLLDIGKNLDEKGVLFIASDYFVDFCSRNAEELSEYFHVPISSKYNIHEALYKDKMNEIAKKAGLNVLKCEIINRDSNLEEKLSGFPELTIVKPANSLQGYKDRMGIANTQKELYKLVDEKFKYCTDLIVMEYIPGDGTRIEEAYGLMLPNKKAFIPFTLKKIRQHPTLLVGSGTLAESTSQEDIREMTRKFVEELQMQGPLHVEYKRHPETNQPIFIEANYRIGSNITLSAAAERNIPYIHYLIATNQQISMDEKSIPGIRWLEEHRDWKLVESGQITKEQLIGEYKNVKAFSIYNSRDPEPFRIETMRNPFRIINEEYIKSLANHN